MAALIFGTTQYLQFVQGYTPLEAGIRFLPASLGLMVGAIGSETLARRYGTTKVVSGGMLLLAATLPLVLLWEVDTPYWAVGSAIAVMGFAAANIFAPATEAVMGAVPEEKAGVGSAMNDITRLMATALGIAVIGSAMNSIYRSKVAAAVTGLPAEAAAAAKDSVGAALQIAASLPGDAGAALSAAATAAFTDAFGLAILIGAAVTLLGALVVARVMPPRQQPLPETKPEQVEEVEAPPVPLPPTRGRLSIATEKRQRAPTSKLTKEKPMLQKLRNRARQAVKGRIETNLDGFELGLTLEDVIADLNFGVGPTVETARSVREGRPEVGRVA